MTRDEVIRMADEAQVWIPILEGKLKEGAIARLSAFAALVAAAEREACAHLIEPKNERSDWAEFARHSADLARMIRARKP